MRRTLLVALGLFAVYAGTLALGEQHRGDAAHHLLIAESIVADGDVDLTDQYAKRAYTEWIPQLAPRGELTDGRRTEPLGVGLPLVIAPAYAVAGPTGAALLVAALLALAFALATRLARRIVPEPYATLGPLLVGLSPPALAAATTVSPEPVAAALLTAAGLFALRARENPRVITAAACGACLAPLPWLMPLLLIPGLLVGGLAVRWLLRRHRGLAALIGAEVLFSSLVAFVTVNDTLYGGLLPDAAEAPGQAGTDAAFPGGYAERAVRLLSLTADAEVGVLAWAPVVVIVLWGAWLLWRSRADRIARALHERFEVEAAAGVALAICAGALLAAAFLLPAVAGEWFPGRWLACAFPAAGALAAWGLRGAPRWLSAVCAALTLASSVWLLAQLAFGDKRWSEVSSPLTEAMPHWGADGDVWATVVTAVTLAGLAVLVVLELRRRRSIEAQASRAF